jgi:polyhydroxybutyrate depolymerase
MRTLVSTFALALALSACSGGESPALLDKSALPARIGGEREAPVHLPREMIEGRAYPLVILLHGYSASGGLQDFYLGLSSLVTEYDFVLVIPDGTEQDPTMGGTVEPEPGTATHRFWNATDACCNFYESDVDDVGYLTGLIDEAVEKLPIDPGRVYFFGHSNGGYMSYRMACDVADRITAIASLAGATFKDPSMCNPSEPVSVLQIHGTLDEPVPYDGNESIPSALESVQYWAAESGCDLDAAREGERLDLDDNLPGDDTDTLYFEEGCAPGFDHALYTIVDGDHLPMSISTKNLSRRTLEWLFDHEKP